MWVNNGFGGILYDQGKNKRRMMKKKIIGYKFRVGKLPRSGFVHVWNISGFKTDRKPEQGDQNIQRIRCRWMGG